MPWQPALGTQPLAPFDHQVAGQSSMLRYDKTTVCKPLIAREHFLYKTLPQELIEFTPEYRGEIEVQLTEENGYIQLYGLSVADEDDDDVGDNVCPCTSIPGNHSHEPLDVRPKVVSRESSFKKNRSTIRVLRSGSYEVSPSTGEVFYAVDSNSDHPHTHSLNPWSLKNHKRLLDKMRKSEHTHNKIRFILLKNVVADFHHPSILDLKIGSRLHGDDASNVKVASQSDKCRRTTSSTLGVRLCGMQVYQVESSAYHSIDKYHGRTLNNESFREMLHSFLHNGTKFRSELIQPIVSRLSQLIDCLENLHSFRFYASSLLIIYDGDVSFIPESQEARIKGPNSDITVDMVPMEQIVENQNSVKEKHQPGDKLTNVGSHSSKDLYHPDSSKELLQPVEDCQCEHPHYSKELLLSLKSQPKELYCDLCSASYPPSLQGLNMGPAKQHHHLLESSSGNILDDVQITPSTGLYHATGLIPLPVKSLQQNHLLKSGKHCHMSPQSNEKEDTCYKHGVGQELVHERISALEAETSPVSSKSALVQGSHHCEPQAVQKLAVETDNFSHVPPSSIHKVDPRLAHPSMNAVVLTRIQDQAPDTVHDLNPHDAFSHVQTDHEIFPSDSKFHDRSGKTQDKRCLTKTATLSSSAVSPEKRIDVQPDPMTSALRSSSHASSSSIKVDVKMIDFAHTTHEGFTADKIKHVGPDSDYICGLRNLMELFLEFRAESN